jgi:hypothetical protein
MALFVGRGVHVDFNDPYVRIGEMIGNPAGADEGVRVRVTVAAHAFPPWVSIESQREALPTPPRVRRIFDASAARATLAVLSAATGTP